MHLVMAALFYKTILIDLKFMELDIKHKRKSLATIHGRLIGAKRTTFLSFIPLVLDYYVLCTSC